MRVLRVGQIWEEENGARYEIVEIDHPSGVLWVRITHFSGLLCDWCLGSAEKGTGGFLRDVLIWDPVEERRRQEEALLLMAAAL